MADTQRPDDRAGTSWGETIRTVGPYLGLGLQLALTMACFAGLGYMIDRWLGTPPWGMLISSGLGLVAVFIQLARTTKSMNASSDPNDEASPPSP